MRPVGAGRTSALRGPEPDDVPAAGGQQQQVESPSPDTKAKSSNGSAVAESKISSAALEAELRSRFGNSAVKKPTPQPIAEDPNLDVNGYFKDADNLKVSDKDYDDQSTANVLHDMIRSDINGSKPGVFTKNFPETFASSSKKDQDDYRYALHDALQDRELTKKIDNDPASKARMENAVRKVAGTDPSIKENAKTDAVVDNFKNWDDYKYKAVIVPGYTPLDQKTPLRLDPVGKERLQAAAAAYKNNMAPFVIVSGGNCHPRRTSFNEAYEMKQELKKMGVPEDRIIVDMKAQHSTTNLRNSGRYMLQHNMIKNENDKAMIITGGGPGAPMFDQKFYMAKPDESSFNKRSIDELGYKVGDLNWVPTDKGTDLGPGMGTLSGPGFQDGYVEYKPSQDVKKFNYKDPLDP